MSQNHNIMNLDTIYNLGNQNSKYSWRIRDLGKSPNRNTIRELRLNV